MSRLRRCFGSNRMTLLVSQLCSYPPPETVGSRQVHPKETLIPQSIPKSFSQFAFQQFTGRTLWNVRDDMNRLGAFVICEIFPAMIDQILLGDLCSILQHDERGNFFPVERVGNADGCRRGDRRMLIEHFINLARINIFATANDHVGFAVHDVKESILVAIADIASMKPAVAERLFGCRGILEITL